VENIVDRQLKVYEKKMEEVMRKLKTLLPKSLPLKTKNGKIILSEDNIMLLENYKETFRDILVEAGYYSLIEDYMNDEATLVKEFADESVEDYIPVVLGVSALATLELIQQTELAGFNTIIEDATNSILIEVRSAIFANEDYVSVLESGVKKLNNKLGNYTTTYMRTTRTVFEQKAIDIAAEEVDEDLYWQYVGPDDNVTRPQCQRGLSQNVFTQLQKNDFQAEGLRWNCRHIFRPVSGRTYNKAMGYI